LFNSALKIGAQMQIQSQLTAANGLWNVTQADHFLSSKEPDGQIAKTLAMGSIVHLMLAAVAQLDI
jgi:hypothetical protein